MGDQFTHIYIYTFHDLKGVRTSELIHNIIYIYIYMQQMDAAATTVEGELRQAGEENRRLRRRLEELTSSYGALYHQLVQAQQLHTKHQQQVCN